VTYVAFCSGPNLMDDSTSYKQTKQGVIPRSQLLPLEAEGIARGLEFVRSGKAYSIISQSILDLHQVAFGPIFDWAGKWRTVDVSFGNLAGPSTFELPVLIEDFCRDLAERLKHIPPQTDTDAFFKELVDLLAWAQHRFVVIHPFNDYNGRIARMLTNAILQSLGLPFVELLAESEADRKAYIQALRDADNHDFTALQNLLYDALKEALQKHLI